MSSDYGSMNGYGIKLDNFNEQKMIKFLLTSDCIKEWLIGKDTAIPNIENDISFIDVFDDYQDDCGEFGIFPAFYDVLYDLEIICWDEYFHLQRDYEDDCFYLIYNPPIFPENYYYSKEKVDKKLKSIMELVDIISDIDYRDIHWFG